MESRGKALLAAGAAESKLAEQVVILDVQEHTPVTDYFVIALIWIRFVPLAITK